MAPSMFISFAKEDIRSRDLFVGQAANSSTPFEIRDMSVQSPFDSKWKTRCRDRIAECDGFIALLSRKTWRADGARWEMRCARELGLPMLGVHIYKDERGAVPPELAGKRVVSWNWKAINRFVQLVNSKRSFWAKLLD